MSYFAILIKTSGEKENIILPLKGMSTLESLQSLVGGTITGVTFYKGLWGYANDDGLSLDLPVNQFATMLYRRAHRRSDLGLVGDIVLVGPPNAKGDDTNVPERYCNYINELYSDYLIQ